MLAMRRLWRRVGAVAFAMLAAATLAGSLAGTTQPVITALAYSCPASNGQQDSFGPQGQHHWLGWCTDWTSDIMYYDGEDNQGRVLDYTYNHLRGWQCGSLLYDQSNTLYGVTSNNLSTPWYLYVCSQQTDSNVNQQINGWYSWWDYLHY